MQLNCFNKNIWLMSTKRKNTARHYAPKKKKVGKIDSNNPVC